MRPATGVATRAVCASSGTICAGRVAITRSTTVRAVSTTIDARFGFAGSRTTSLAGRPLRVSAGASLVQPAMVSSAAVAAIVVRIIVSRGNAPSPRVRSVGCPAGS